MIDDQQKTSIAPAGQQVFANPSASCTTPAALPSTNTHFNLGPAIMSPQSNTMQNTFPEANTITGTTKNLNMFLPATCNSIFHPLQ